MTIRRSFLEEEKWLTVPWALELGPKRPQSQLLDILVYVPGLLEDKKILDSSDHNLHPNLHTTLLNNVITRLTDLFEWRWRWQAQNPNSVRTLAVPTPTQRARRRPPELPVLEFASTLHSGELILYNLVLLWLLNLLWTLAPPSSISSILSTAASSALSLLNLSRSFSYQPSHPFIHTSPPSTFPLRPPGKITHLRIAAIEIARCFEYQIESIKTARVNLLFFMMPLGLARSVLQDEDKYLDWIIDMVASTRFTRAYAQSTSTNAFGFKFGFRFGFESGQGGGSDPNNIKGGAPGPLTADKIDGGGNGLTAESNSTETPKYNIMGSIVSTPKSSNPGSSRGGSIPKSSNYGSSRGESIPIIEGPTPSDGGSEGLRVPTSNQTPQEPMEFMPCSPQRKAVLTASYGMVGDGTPHMMGIGTSTAESQSGIGTGYPATPTTLGDGRYGHGLATPETSPGFTPGDTSTAANFEGAEDSTGHMGIPEPNPVLGHTGGEVYPSGGESRGFGY